MYHNPVLLKEALEGLDIRPEGIYADMTFGGGGHSKAIFEKLTTGKLYAFDQDEDAQPNAWSDERFVLIPQNFRYLKKYMRYYKAIPVDGILADLGVSSHQFDEASRGFSTRFDADLDMRMNRQAGLSAKEVINEYSENELQHIFHYYGELPHPKKAASLIVAQRKRAPINTIEELKNSVKSIITWGKENQYYAQLFQALRIEVNEELEVLKEMLIQSGEVLKPGGRLVVISYHSLEDRLVKDFITKGNFEGKEEKDLFGNLLNCPFRPLNKKPIIAGDIELKENPRSRSAKLRIAIKN